eukprot:gene5467-6150_t
MEEANSPCVVDYEDEHHNHKIVGKMNQLRTSGTLVDIWPVVEGIEFPAHSIVLACSSDYFLALCESNLIPKDRRIHIHDDLSSYTFKELLDFMYTGKIQITLDNVENLLRGSSMLLLEKVKKKCSAYLHTCLNDCNCIGILSIADELSCDDLANRALKFTQQYFSDVWLNPEFEHLPFHLLFKLISSDATSVPSEDIMFAAILKWVSVSETRQSLFPKLFLSIRLRFVSEKVFELDMFENSLIIDNPECFQRLNEATNYRQEIRDSNRRKSSQELVDTTWLRPRLCMSQVEVIVAVGGVHALLYNAEMNEWVQLSAVTTRHCPGMGVIDNDLVIIGGSREWKRLAAGVRYDPKRNEWLGMVALNHNRSNLEIAFLDGYLYAVGGYDGDSPLNSVERFDPKHNRWEFIAPMKHARDGLCVVCDDEYMYAISGYDGHKYLSSVERYDPYKNRWEINGFEHIKQYRQCASSVINDGKAYIFGGYFDSTFLSSCEVYDIDNNTWSTIASMNRQRYQTGAAVLNRWIFVCGGWTGDSQASSLVECYHIDEDTWFTVASLPTPCTVRCASLMFPRKQLEKIINSQEEIRKLEARKVAEDFT